MSIKTRLKDAVLSVVFWVGIAIIGTIAIPIVILLGIIYSLLEFVGNPDDE